VYFCFELGFFVLELVEFDAVWDWEDDFEEYLVLDDFWEVWLRLLKIYQLLKLFGEMQQH
jgi:hypothetical protein